LSGFSKASVEFPQKFSPLRGAFARLFRLFFFLLRLRVKSVSSAARKVLLFSPNEGPLLFFPWIYFLTDPPFNPLEWSPRVSKSVSRVPSAPFPIAVRATSPKPNGKSFSLLRSCTLPPPLVSLAGFHDYSTVMHQTFFFSPFRFSVDSSP